jgi:hypothetical protein
MPSKVPENIISRHDWHQMAAKHLRRAERYTRPARKRRDHGEVNPVEDFLFQYYPFPLALLEKWHPGLGVTLEHPSATLAAPFSSRNYSITDGVIFADISLLPEKARLRLRWIRKLLEATRNRAPNFACHGLHEWAMVYRGRDIRHERTTSLRLPQSEIDAFIESRPICCSHFDAFRFFAPDAQPMNRLQPTLDARISFEQPGCVHANMDLYKWAAKAMPWIGTSLLLDCFEQAIELRELDMRASPYDLKKWAREPIKIETHEGRKTYEHLQKQLATNAFEIREQLITALLKIDSEEII